MTPADQQAVLAEARRRAASAEEVARRIDRPDYLSDAEIIRALLSLVASPAPAVEVRGVVTMTGEVIEILDDDDEPEMRLSTGDMGDEMLAPLLPGAKYGDKVTIAITPGGMPGEE